MEVELFNWLERNAGNWSCNPDRDWYEVGGDSDLAKRPRVLFVAYGVGYPSLTLREAIKKAMVKHG